MPAGLEVTFPLPGVVLATVTTGNGVMAKGRAFVVPPPGDGVNTVTWAVPATAISALAMPAWSWVGLL